MDHGEAIRQILATHPELPPSLRFVLQSLETQYEQLEVDYQRALRWVEEVVLEQS